MLTLNKNKILKNLVSGIGNIANTAGSSMIDYAKKDNPWADNIYQSFFDVGPVETVSASTGNNYTVNPLLLKYKQLKEDVKGYLKDKAYGTGSKWYKWGASVQPRDMQMKEFYKNNLPLSDYGKKKLEDTIINFPTDVLSYVKTNAPRNWGQISDLNQTGIGNYVSISPAAATNKKREVLFHELAHRVDVMSKISNDKNFQNTVVKEGTDNPYFKKYIDSRINDYGGEFIDPREIYAIVSEYLHQFSSGVGVRRIPVSKDLLKYYPQYAIPKKK